MQRCAGQFAQKVNDPSPHDKNEWEIKYRLQLGRARAYPALVRLLGPGVALALGLGASTCTSTGFGLGLGAAARVLGALGLALGRTTVLGLVGLALGAASSRTYL